MTVSFDYKHDVSEFLQYLDSQGYDWLWMDVVVKECHYEVYLVTNNRIGLVDRLDVRVKWLDIVKQGNKNLALRYSILNIYTEAEYRRIFDNKGAFRIENGYHARRG